MSRGLEQAGICVGPTMKVEREEKRQLKEQEKWMKVPDRVEQELNVTTEPTGHNTDMK